MFGYKLYRIISQLKTGRHYRTIYGKSIRIGVSSWKKYCVIRRSRKRLHKSLGTNFNPRPIRCFVPNSILRIFIIYPTDGLGLTMCTMNTSVHLQNDFHPTQIGPKIFGRIFFVKNLWKIQNIWRQNILPEKCGLKSLAKNILKQYLWNQLRFRNIPNKYQ